MAKSLPEGLGDLVYHCGEGRPQVFMVGSLGVLKSDITQIYPIAGGTQTFTRDESSFAWGGGAGVKVFLKPQISLRPQFRFVFSERTGVTGQATGSVAVGFTGRTTLLSQVDVSNID